MELLQYLSLSQFSQFSSGQLQHLRLRCEVAVPLAAGGLHALRKGLAAKMCHGHPCHPWSKHGLLFHTIYFPTDHKGMVPFIGIQYTVPIPFNPFQSRMIVTVG